MILLAIDVAASLPVHRETRGALAALSVAVIVGAVEWWMGDHERAIWSVLLISIPVAVAFMYDGYKRRRGAAARK